MLENNWMLFGIGILLAIFAIISIVLIKGKKREKKPIDYYAWFLIGVIWLIVGIINIKLNFFFLIMGLFFLIMGLSHKKEWKKNHEANKWKNLSKTEKDIRIFIMIVFGILILAGLILFLMTI